MERIKGYDTTFDFLIEKDNGHYGGYWIEGFIKEINTTLGSGPIENVTFNESKNVFTGTLLSKDNDYKFEICAKSGDVILQEEIKK